MPVDGKDFPSMSLPGVSGLESFQRQKSSALLHKAQSLQNNVAGPGVARDTGISRSADSPAEAEKAATEFEALLLHQMLQAMWSTVPSEGMLGGSREEDLYRDMFNEALSKQIAEGQSIGIKEVVLKDFSKLEIK